MRTRSTACVGIVSALFLLAFARPALAGPPLLCHPYEIGAAQSLPWQGHDWWPGRDDYKVANLVADTQALLTPDTPVIVRMETLRRATIYAMRDRNIATQLIATITKRAHALERDFTPQVAVVRLEHAAQPTIGDLPKDFVAVLAHVMMWGTEARGRGGRWPS